MVTTSRPPHAGSSKAKAAFSSEMAPLRLGYVATQTSRHAGLHRAVQNDVFVLFDQIARAEHGLDVEVVDVVGDPRRAEVEQRLVDVVFGIALRVAQQDHGKRIGIGEFLTVGAVLRLSGEGDERRHAAEK